MTVAKDVAHRPVHAGSPVRLAWIQRAATLFTSTVKAGRQQVAYWQGLFFDVRQSEEFPFDRLWFAVGVAALGLAFALASVSWVPPNASVPAMPPGWGLVLAWTCVTLCLASFLAVLLLFGELLFSRTDGVRRHAVDKLSQNVKDFRIIYDDLLADKREAQLDFTAPRFRELEQELPIHLNRYRSIKRAQFVLVVFSGIVASLMVFAALYITVVNLELQFWHKLPTFEFRDLQGGQLHRLLSAVHTSVAMFGSMGVGYVACPLIKIISVMEVVFAGVVVFFGLNMALAFQQDAVNLPEPEVLLAIKRKLKNATPIAT